MSNVCIGMLWRDYGKRTRMRHTFIFVKNKQMIKKALILTKISYGLFVSINSGEV
jgi:hypothetical protein